MMSQERYQHSESEPRTKLAITMIYDSDSTRLTFWKKQLLQIVAVQAEHLHIFFPFYGKRIKMSITSHPLNALLDMESLNRAR